MNEHEKVLEAAKVIKEYCSTRPNKNDCKGCIFRLDGYPWGGCIFSEPPEVPFFWNLRKAERKCGELGGSVCGTTGLKCIRCNPGPCEHRRESNDSGNSN